MPMMTMRRSGLAFWLGCAIVTIGVAMHVPMYAMGRDMHYVLADMPMTDAMRWGMAAIVLGILLAGYGLLPRLPHRRDRVVEAIVPPENAPLSPAHWRVVALLALALVIDIMKPASLGFVIPGMRDEYGIDPVTAGWLPLAALCGTVVGSLVWGLLADLYGRRAAILLSSVIFIGTSICGAMPEFWWNVGMCFLMGAAAGGMLPVAYALLAEIMPTRQRGWILVLTGGIGAVGGVLAASALSSLLQPAFGWRIMWFLNLPTGLLLVLVSPFLPESARFLQQMGRAAEARIALSRFGVVAMPLAHDAGRAKPAHPTELNAADGFLGVTAALTLAALAWGVVNFGVLLWLPSALVAEGRSIEASSALIAQSTLIAAPTILLSSWLYGKWSTKWALIAMIGITAMGLGALVLRASGIGALANPMPAVTLLILGSCGVISILLPYTAENYPLRVRGRATGWVAACSKLGGLIAQGVSVLIAVPPLPAVALAIGLPAIGSMMLIARFGRETRGRDLRDLERETRGRAR